MSTDPRFAEPTPFARLVYAHAVSVAGDACLTVSLAGSLFFQSPTNSGAREGAALPAVDDGAVRHRGADPRPDDRPHRGRVAGCSWWQSSAGRAVLCLFMAMYVSKAAPEGLLVYPLAFGALVLAKGHSIAKSALVPALVKSDDELVNANSRLALFSVIAATVGGLPAAAIQQLFGADWSLRVAAVVFVVAALLATRIPKTPRAETDQRQQQLENEEIHQPSILLAGSATAVLRGSVGFLAFFVAFALKNNLFGLGHGARRQRARRVHRRGRRTGAPQVDARRGDPRVGARGAGGVRVAGRGVRRCDRLRGRRVRARDRRSGGSPRLRQRAAARRPGRGARACLRSFRDALPAGVGGGRHPRPAPAAPSRSGCSCSAIVLGFAAVSYVGALRAAGKRGMRSKLLPDSVDRAITRSRTHAIGKVRRRFRKSTPDDVGGSATRPNRRRCGRRRRTSDRRTRTVEPAAAEPAELTRATGPGGRCAPARGRARRARSVWGASPRSPTDGSGRRARRVRSRRRRTLGPARSARVRA